MSAASFPDAVELDSAHLRLRWPDGDVVLSVLSLRAACRCAHCVAAARGDHASPGDDGIALAGAEPVGQYALRLFFSDGHARGIYPWTMLRELGAYALDPDGEFM